MRQRPPRTFRGRWITTVLAVVPVALLGSSGLTLESSAQSPLIEQARERELEHLQQRVGKFSSGQAAVYAGEVEAAVLEGGTPIGRLARGRVVAAMEERGGGVSLTVVSRDQGLWLRLAQHRDEPGVTRITTVRPLRGSTGVTASCNGCLEDLRERPAILHLPRFVAHGKGSDPLGTPFRVELSGRLEKLKTADLQLDQLEPLNPGLDSFLEGEAEAFERYGKEGILRVQREIRERVEPEQGLPPQTRCERVLHYTAERHVDLGDLRSFGVRKLKPLKTEICCFDHDSHGESEECSPEGGAR